MPLNASTAQKINKFVKYLLEQASPNSKEMLQFIGDKWEAAHANEVLLQSTVDGMVLKQQNSQRNRAKAHCGDARHLTVAEANKKIQEREEKEREKAAKSERFQALRGRVQFAKAI